MEDTQNMIKVAGVKFRSTGKMYYFDPGELELAPGDKVIVETARGMEFANVTLGVTEIRDEDVVHPLKKVVRVADEDDLKRHEEYEGKKGQAMELCREKILKHQLEMKLIDVEFTFDNNKIIFYFTADGRVDFRDLVKDLASVFKMRIELRQVGVRDEAKMLGGIGCCGRELCCASWLSDFQPVSIKMTKTQNLSLNPTKISGVCGRLMCCLKYENSTYLELRKNMPDVNERVRVSGKLGKVIESNILKGIVKVRMYTGEKDENGREKLDSEILTLLRDEVERIGKKAASQQDDGNEKKGCPCGNCPGKQSGYAGNGEDEVPQYGMEEQDDYMSVAVLDASDESASGETEVEEILSADESETETGGDFDGIGETGEPAEASDPEASTEVGDDADAAGVTEDVEDRNRRKSGHSNHRRKPRNDRRDSDRHDRNHRDRNDRKDRNNRNERSDRRNRNDWNDRNDRVDRNGRNKDRGRSNGSRRGGSSHRRNSSQKQKKPQKTEVIFQSFAPRSSEDK